MIMYGRSQIARPLVWIVVFACTTLGASLQAGEITGIVAFGDSLSDVGNVYLATGGVNPNPPNPPNLYPGGSFPGGSYDSGRYSNGPVWLEYLAHSLGVAAPTPSLLGGTDNAWGGAETGNGLSFEGTPNIGLQISTYLASHTLSSTQLVSIWGGANDFLNGGQTNPAVPVANLISDITTLAAAGGKQFLVPNLPLLGDLPATINTPVSGPLNFLSSTFDSMLHTQLDQLSQQLGITIYQVDVNSTFQSIMADPAAFGLTDVVHPAYLDPNYKGQGYFFWDFVHPTTEVHALIGAEAYGAIVPEPSSWALALIAAPALLLAWRRRAAFTSPGPRPRDDSGQA
jgi:phospholipase/lecithinase/hemolysin